MQPVCNLTSLRTRQGKVVMNEESAQHWRHSENSFALGTALTCLHLIFYMFVRRSCRIYFDGLQVIVQYLLYLRE